MDAALHHYDTLHVDDISYISSAYAHHVVRFSALGRDFHLILEWDRNLFTEDFSVHSVDAEGRHHLHPIQQESFLHGHLNSKNCSCAKLLCQHCDYVQTGRGTPLSRPIFPKRGSSRR